MGDRDGSSKRPADDDLECETPAKKFKPVTGYEESTVVDEGGKTLAPSTTGDKKQEVIEIEKIDTDFVVKENTTCAPAKSLGESELIFYDLGEPECIEEVTTTASTDDYFIDTGNPSDDIDLNLENDSILKIKSPSITINEDLNERKSNNENQMEAIPQSVEIEEIHPNRNNEIESDKSNIKCYAEHNKFKFTENVPPKDILLVENLKKTAGQSLPCLNHHSSKVSNLKIVSIESFHRVNMEENLKPSKIINLNNHSRSDVKGSIEMSLGSADEIKNKLEIVRTEEPKVHSNAPEEESKSALSENIKEPPETNAEKSPILVDEAVKEEEVVEDIINTPIDEESPISVTDCKTIVFENEKASISLVDDDGTVGPQPKSADNSGITITEEIVLSDGDDDVKTDDDDLQIVSEVVNQKLPTPPLLKPLKVNSISDVLALYPKATVISAKDITTPLSTTGGYILKVPSLLNLKKYIGKSDVSPIPEICLDSPEEIEKPITPHIKSPVPLKDFSIKVPRIPLQFSWDEYLSRTKADTSPESAFLQVERSMEYGIQPGEVLEIVKKTRLPKEYVNSFQSEEPSSPTKDDEGEPKAYSKVFKNESQSLNDCNPNDPVKVDDIANKVVEGNACPSGDVASSLVTLKDPTSSCDPPSENSKIKQQKNEEYMSKIEEDGSKKDDEEVLTFWPVEVLAAFGPLLRVSCLLPDDIPTQDFWCDINSEECCYFSYGSEKQLIPFPNEDAFAGGSPPLSELVVHLEKSLERASDISPIRNGSLRQLVSTYVSLVRGDRPPIRREVFEESTARLWQRVPQGCVIEVLSSNALTGWPAKVLHNKGGRLSLQYLDANASLKTPPTPFGHGVETSRKDTDSYLQEHKGASVNADDSGKREDSSLTDGSSEKMHTDSCGTMSGDNRGHHHTSLVGESFVLFCTDDRLRNPGFVGRSTNYRYRDPLHPEADAPPDFTRYIETLSHPLQEEPLEDCSNAGVKTGDCLELLNPVSLDAIHAARVSKVGDHSIEVSYFEEDGKVEKSFEGSMSDYRILPVGFTERFNLKLIPLPDTTEVGSTDQLFSWKKYMEKHNCESISGDKFKNREDFDESEFATGQKLEVEHRSHPSALCVATIESVTEHLLWIKCDLNDCSQIQCSEYCTESKLESAALMVNCMRKNETMMAVPFDSGRIFPAGFAQKNGIPLYIPFSCGVKATRTLPDFTMARNVATFSVCEILNDISADTKWCPEMVLNHRCFPGQFLSKLKLSCQPGTAVAGPVCSVLSQVVSQTLGAAFCQSKLTKDLSAAFQEVAELRHTWESLPIKAKCKRFSVRSTVMAPTHTKDVHIFMKVLYDTLQCCPNLWSYKKLHCCPYSCNESSPQMLVDKHNAALLLSPKKRQFSTSLLGNKMDDDDDDDEDDRELERIEKELITKPPSVDKSELPELRRLEGPGRRKQKLKRSFAIEPADVMTDPMLWSVDQVFDFVSREQTVSHHAPWLKTQSVDGEALMLLDLPTLIEFSRQPHSSLLPLAHQLCKLKMAHILMNN